jgi:hypothetical protein
MQVDFVAAITAALNREGARGSYLEHPASKYVNMLIVPEGSTIDVDEQALGEMGVTSVQYVASHKDDRGRSFFDADKLVACFQSTFVIPFNTTATIPE